MVRKPAKHNVLANLTVLSWISVRSVGTPEMCKYISVEVSNLFLGSICLTTAILILVCGRPNATRRGGGVFFFRSASQRVLCFSAM